ncbi:lipocalin-like domain-containing protein [Streptomyces sp. NPDC086777]|uniref:lipocalin-like domain-containing protein n=1 Tax=Streptomyces sp. NPDC086777 TaxID=3154866 RepID=UPI00344B6B77
MRLTGTEQLLEAARAFRGQLSATLHAEADHRAHAQRLLPILERRTGRIVFNAFSIPQEVSCASTHGGPFPATSDSRFTSAGMGAIERFIRPVTYQNFLDDLLPDALRAANPENLWRVVDDDVVQPLGPTPCGLIVYTPEGYMAAQLGRGDRAPLPSARLEDAASDDLARAAIGYIAYGGPFTVVDPATVEHHVTTSLFPNWIGRPQVRTVTFDGSYVRLAVAAPTRLWGADRTAELTWSRAA